MKNETEKWETFCKFLLKHGRSLIEYIPSYNFILKKRDAIEAIQLLDKLEISVPISGIDLLADRNGSLDYVFPGWSSDNETIDIKINRKCALNYIDETDNFIKQEKDEIFYYDILIYNQDDYIYPIFKKWGILRDIGFEDDPFWPFD